MKKHNTHKKDLTPKEKDQIGDTMHHGKSTNIKVKYNHKNHWLEEDEEEEVPHKVKKKKKLN